MQKLSGHSGRSHLGRSIGLVMLGVLLLFSGSTFMQSGVVFAQDDLDLWTLLPIVRSGENSDGAEIVASDDSYQTVQNAPLSIDAARGVLANDQGGAPLRAVLGNDAANGLLSLRPDGAFTYTPNPNFTGQDAFTYQATNGVATSNLATVILNVAATAAEPVALNDSYTLAGDTVLTVNAAAGVLANDMAGGQQDALRAQLADDVTAGVLDFNADGSFTYAPSPTFSGEDRFTYRALEGELASDLATVTIVVESIAAPNQAPHIVSGAVDFERQILDDAMGETHSVVAADFDNDGDMDAAATDYVDGAVYWYRNDGRGAFEILLLDGELEGAYPSHADDVDQDGDVDIFAAGYLADTYVWYRNEGNGNFSRRDIDTAADGPHALITSDLDGDGDIDLVTANQDAGEVAWYENDGANNFAKRLVDRGALGAKRVDAVDVNQDGHIDIIAASFDIDEIAWYANDGNQNFTKYSITTDANGAYYVAAADADGDGDIDLFSASQLNNQIWWYRNDGAQNFTQFTIDADSPGARTVLVADVDRDGDIDALGTSVIYDSASWYENDGSGSFTERPIDLDADGVYGIFATDMDYDGDLDVLSASRDANVIALHTQIQSHFAAVEKGGALTIDDALLNTVDGDESDGPAALTYTIAAAPRFGELRLGGARLSVGSAFTQADVDNGDLTYAHAGVNEVADTFRFTVADGGESGVQPASGVFTIDIVAAGD